LSISPWESSGRREERTRLRPPLICALSLAAALSCQPKARLSFTDITSSAGTGGPTAPGRLGGHAVVFADVDGDGLPDLYITMLFDDPMPDLFFHNTGNGRFADEAAARGIDDFDGGSHGACFADLDNDGDYDLVNGTTYEEPQSPGVNNIFRNDGSGHFSDVTVESGIPAAPRWPTRAVLAFDMDSDGDLDLFAVTNYKGSDDPAGERNEIYRNLGGMRFQPAVSETLAAAPAGQGAIDTDYDGDGDVDVIAANRTGPVNVLRNEGGGRFSTVTPESIGITHRAEDGISAGDVDNDGDLDLVLAGDDYGHLYLNQGGGDFVFRQSFLDTDGYMAGLADLDNDGDLDIVFAGDDVVYLNDGSGRFLAGPKVPVEGINDPRAIAFADIDGDGDLDFAVGCKRSRNWLVRNDLVEGHWLKVKLVSAKGQAGAFGAKVYLYPAGLAGAGPILGMREARSNNGYLGQNDPVLHFGLGKVRQADVVVQFLGGPRVVLRKVPANQTITIDAREATASGAAALDGE